MNRMSWMVVLGLCAAFAGCRNVPQTWRVPGPVQQQRYQAAAQDPFPTTDEGPELVGVRPRDYQKPFAEPVRNKYFWDNWFQASPAGR